MKNNWQKYTIEKLIKNDGIFVDGDWVESKDQDPNGGVRLIQLADIGEGKFLNKSNRYLTKDKAIKLNCTFLQENDVLFSRLGEPLGKSTLFTKLPGEYVTVVDVAIIRPNNSNLNNKLLVYLFNSPLFREDVEKLKSGTTRKRISRKNLSKVEFNLPEKVSQDDLTQKLDSLFSKIDAGEEGLQKVQQQLEVYRNLSLRKLYEGDAESSSDFIKLKLPKNWSWKSFSEISEIKGGIAKNSNSRIKEYRELPYLRVANVQRGFLDLSEIKKIKVPANRIDDYLLKNGDILLNEGGDIDKLGRGWVWENQIPDCVHQNHVFRARVDQNKFSPKFISMYINLFAQEYFIHRGKQTTNLASISLSKLRELPVPVAPIGEQEEVLNTANRIESIILHVRDSITYAYDESKSLRQSILKKAFNGELI